MTTKKMLEKKYTSKINALHGKRNDEVSKATDKINKKYGPKISAMYKEWREALAKLAEPKGGK